MPERFRGSRFNGTIFVDALLARVARKGWRLGPSCHLFTLPGWEDDLHELAASIGLKRGWFQDQAVMPHYDLTGSRRELAVRRGAVELGRAETVKIIRQWREQKARVTAEALSGQCEEPTGEIRNARRVRQPEILSPEEVSAQFATLLGPWRATRPQAIAGRSA